MPEAEWCRFKTQLQTNYVTFLANYIFDDSHYFLNCLLIELLVQFKTELQFN